MAIRLSAPKNKQGFYLVRAGAPVPVAVDFLNSNTDGTAATTTIRIALDCYSSSGASVHTETTKQSVTVPGTEGGSGNVKKVWQGTVSISGKCHTIGVNSVADGGVYALVGPSASAGGAASAPIQITR